MKVDLVLGLARGNPGMSQDGMFAPKLTEPTTQRQLTVNSS